jgi:hypothetical protein
LLFKKENVMATLQERNGSFRLLFVHHGKRHTFTLGKVSDDDTVPGKGQDPEQPKVDDDTKDEKVPVRRLNVERDALPSPAAENSPFGRSSAKVVRNVEDLEKQVGAAAAKALCEATRFRQGTGCRGELDRLGRCKVAL